MLRDYTETCLRTAGPQYNRALQDLLNHAAQLMGFEVQFGRYSGVTNDIGYDGIWEADDLYVVVEVKTTDAYTIQTSVLLNYINSLVDTQRIPSPDDALGLYVVGRTDAQLSGLENAIVAEKRLQQLRVATVESVLSLAELAQDGLINIKEIVAVITPGGVLVDDTVKLLARVAAKESVPPAAIDAPVIAAASPKSGAEPPSIPAVATSQADKRTFFLTPVADEKESSAQETIKILLGSGWYVFGQRTAGRKDLKPGDRIAFYESGRGVVAAAEVASHPETGHKIAGVRNVDRFPWAFRVKDPEYFFNDPVVIDAERRSTLDAFLGKDPAKGWAWFVQGTRFLTEHDFNVLTRRTGV